MPIKVKHLVTDRSFLYLLSLIHQAALAHSQQCPQLPVLIFQPSYGQLHPFFNYYGDSDSTGKR